MSQPIIYMWHQDNCTCLLAPSYEEQSAEADWYIEEGGERLSFTVNAGLLIVFFFCTHKSALVRSSVRSNSKMLDKNGPRCVVTSNSVTY